MDRGQRLNSPEQELERIRTVYAAYDRSERVQRRWDPHNPGNVAIEDEKAHHIERLLVSTGRWPAHERVLEIGCGAGNMLVCLRSLGIPEQNLHGVDLLPGRIAAARRRLPQAHLTCGNGAELPFPSGHFSLVLLFTVLSSIQTPAMNQALASEAARVLWPGGAVLWYDLRRPNPYNPEVRAVPRNELRRLFPKFRQDLTSATLLPPLARRLGTAAPQLYPLLAALPFLRTHWLGLLVKPTADSGATAPDVLAAPVGRCDRASLAGEGRALCSARLRVAAKGTSHA